MISSMTGFGAVSLKTDNIFLSVQIKSVNGRFLETRFRMPRDYAPLEPEIKRLLGKKIHRGTVDISIHRVFGAEHGATTVIPNISLGKAWLEAGQTLAQELNVPFHPTVDSLLRVPEMMQVPEQMKLENWETQAILECVEKALLACHEEKMREGQEQHRVLNGLLDSLSAFIDQVKKRKKDIDSKLKAKLMERLKLIGEGINIDPHRISQEVIFLAEKADIDEEITRAEAHIRAFRKALDGSGSMGKKLEFYTQELHREINTMGAKTQALDVTLDVIEAKTQVERLREQVQNVE